MILPESIPLVRIINSGSIFEEGGNMEQWRNLF
jgi:hypothetical protein